jgi:Fe-S-cluster containining protein
MFTIGFRPESGPSDAMPPLQSPEPLPPPLAAAIERLYAELDARVRALGVGCWVRGDCCDFERSEHRLYASTIEVAHVIAKHGSGLAADGAPPRDAAAAKLCPFWKAGKCTERERRPLGCRTYFCDPRFREPLAALYEEYHGRLRSLAREWRVPWEYAPFVSALRARGAEETSA